MSAVAAVGPHVHCKLSGLAMPLRSMAPQAFRPWIEHCLEAFGVERSFFASNFPPMEWAGRSTSSTRRSMR